MSAVPHGHWKTTKFVAGLRQAGVVAPLVPDGPMNRAAFRAYVEQKLAPALRPGVVVIMDNLSAHKIAGVHEALEARRAGLPAAVLAGPEPDRAAIREAQGAAAQGGRPHRRHPLGGHRRAARELRTQRVRQLLPARRLWLNLNRICSSS